MIRLALAFWLVATSLAFGQVGSNATYVTPSSSAAGPLTFAWTAGNSDATTPTPPKTFSSQAIGTASSDRYVTFGISWEGTGGAGFPTQMDIPLTTGVSINGVNASNVFYSRPTAGNRGNAMWISAAPVTTGTTTNIIVSGYSNGFISSMVINVGTIKGSLTTSVSGSPITSPDYPNGLTTSPTITVPPNGVAVINGFADQNGGGVGCVTTWSGATHDNDQWDGVNFGVCGTTAHTTTTGTVSETSLTPAGGLAGWLAANFKP